MSAHSLAIGKPIPAGLVHKLERGDQLLNSLTGFVFVLYSTGPDGSVLDEYGGFHSLSALTYLGRPDPEDDGFMLWEGGENPLPGGMVNVRYRVDLGADDLAYKADVRDWLHSPGKDDPADIIGWRPAPSVEDGDRLKAEFDQFRADFNRIRDDGSLPEAAPLSVPSQREAKVTDQMVEAALYATVPGGAQVMAWLPMHMTADGEMPHPVAEMVMRTAITAALSAADRGEGGK